MRNHCQVRVEVSSEGTTINQAFQDSLQPTEEVPAGESLEGMETVEAPSQVADKKGGLQSTTAYEDIVRNFYEHYKRRGDQSETKVGPTVEVNKKYRQLFIATLGGCWKHVNEILLEDSEAITAAIMTVEGQSITVLDIAVIAAQDQLVEKLVKPLAEKNQNHILGRVLCNAARGGRIKVVKALVDSIDVKSESVDSIDVKSESVAQALSMAISWAPMQKEVIWYLAEHTNRASTLDVSRLLMAGHLDIAYHLTEKCRPSATIEDTDFDEQLEYLVSTMSYFRSRATLSFWEKCIYKCIPESLINSSFCNSRMAEACSFKRVIDTKLRHQGSSAFGLLAIFVNRISEGAPQMLESLLTSGIVLKAASRGISEFVELCLQNFPELMWEKNFTNDLIKEVVKGRHIELFRLVNTHIITPYLTNDKRTSCELIDKRTSCELMEAVVEWPPGRVPADVSGAAFLTQRELQWFKVVEDRSHPSLKSMRFKVLNENSSDPSFKSLKLEKTEERRGKTYWEIFVEQRQNLLKEARQWMKDTSSSCSLVATLIITVAFAAGFTVPGGNDSSRGIPIFLQRGSFIVFAIADALALFSSVTATLMFLAILTSRYAIDDFLHSLPRKMILGLTFLFLSLAFMLVAFGSALTIVLSERFKSIYIPITLLAAIPVILFAILQLPLYVEMVESTYWPPLYRPMKLWTHEGLEKIPAIIESGQE